jgi:hypothetical protein
MVFTLAFVTKIRYASKNLLPIVRYLTTLISCPQILAQASTDEAAITEAVNLTSDGEALVYKEFVGLDDLQAGLKLFQQSLAIFKKYGAKGGEANSLVDIGYVKGNIQRRWSPLSQLWPFIKLQATAKINGYLYLIWAKYM